jgi:hypothetical protein
MEEELRKLSRAGFEAAKSKASNKESKPKPARFINRVDFCSALLLELSRPAQKRLLPKPLCRLRIAPSLLANDNVKLLMYIASKLDHRFAPVKLRVGSLV